MDKIFEIEMPQLPNPANYGEAEKAQVGIAMAAVAAMARTTWISLASQRLVGKRRDFDDYWHSIQEPQILDNVATISLVGKRAHDIEFGRASYDLRDVLLGPKVPVKRRGQDGKGKYESKKGGYYRPIPFSHSGPDAQGATGQPMGMQFANLKVGAMSAPEAKSLGSFIFKAAKELRASTEQPNRKVKWGERLVAGLAPKLREHHKTDIFAGMVRIEKMYRNANTGRTTTQSTFKTFRTISTRKKIGWRVPATSGYRIMELLKVHMAQHAPGLVNQILSGNSAPAAPSPPPAT